MACEHCFRDPAVLMDEIASHSSLTPGLALLAVVEDPATEQRLTHLERLPVDSRLEHYEQVRDVLYETMQRLLIPDFAGPDTRHSVLTVVVRPGFTVIGRHEQAWCLGWRYSNHGRGAWDGDLAVVTEHGWYELLSRWAGRSPAIQQA